MTDVDIVVPRTVLQAGLQRLSSAPRWPVRLAAHWNMTGKCRQLLLSSLPPGREGGSTFRLHAHLAAAQEDDGPTGYLLIDHEQNEMLARVRTEDGQKLLPRHLLLVGPGMKQLLLRGENETITASERWSRFIGALDLDTLAAFANLRFVLVGAGRNGSLMASSLMHAGVRHLTLMDPDIMELHNLDAMDGVTEADIGHPKAEALAQGLRRADGSGPRAVVCSVVTPRGIATLRAADVIISCVDDDGARLATAMVAALYMKPLLDIGSGIMRTAGERQMGGDVRLVLPGEGRCLACFGGLARMQDIEALLRNRTIERPWNAERAGSLRSLNQINVHLGLRLLEDLFAGEVERSTWLRLTWQGNVPSIEEIVPPTRRDCPLCQCEGMGDESLADMPRLARNVHAWLSG